MVRTLLTSEDPVDRTMISGQQYELLEWLNNVTFPMEAKFSDIEFARRSYESAVRRIIDCGVCSSFIYLYAIIITNTVFLQRLLHVAITGHFI